MRALKIVSSYESQSTVEKSTATEAFNIEEHFRSSALKAIYNCYQDTFGMQKRKLSLQDLRKLDIKNLYRFRGFGQKAEEKLIELLEASARNKRKYNKSV
jgi:hypothetical protein